MKRKDLIMLLRKKGWYLKRRSRNHDIYTNWIKSEPIPRYKEINERLAMEIIKKHGL